MIACMINISSLNFDNSLNSASSVLSIIILMFLALAIALETYVIYKHHGQYEDSEFKQNYGACIEGLNTSAFVGRYWNPLTLTRWAITSLIMIFLRDHCVLQIFILLALSAIFQISLLRAKPMAENFDRWMALGIEASVSIYLYGLLSLTDFTGGNTPRIEQGWFLATLTGIVIGINVASFIWKILCRAFKFIKQVLQLCPSGK